VSKLAFTVDAEVAANGKPFVNLHAFCGWLSFMVQLDGQGLAALADELESQVLQNRPWVRLRLNTGPMEVETLLDLPEAMLLAKDLKRGLQQAIRQAAQLAPLRAVVTPA